MPKTAGEQVASTPMNAPPNDKMIDSKRVVFGVIEGLENGRIVPGQRLVEADLCARFGVGRAAVREALHRLEEVGVVELSRHKGATIVEHSLSDALDSMELVEVLNGLSARAAARAAKKGGDTSQLANAMSALVAAINNLDTAAFSHARRAFHAALLHIGGQRDLQRICATLTIHVLRAQYGTSVHKAFAEDFMAIGSAVLAGNESAAEDAARNHVKRVCLALKTSLGEVTVA